MSIGSKIGSYKAFNFHIFPLTHTILAYFARVWKTIELLMIAVAFKKMHIVESHETTID